MSSILRWNPTLYLHCVIQWIRWPLGCDGMSVHTVTSCPMVWDSVSVGLCGKPETECTWTAFTGRSECGLPPKPQGLLLGLVTGFLQNSCLFTEPSIPTGSAGSSWENRQASLLWSCYRVLLSGQPYWSPECRLELHVQNSEKPTNHEALLFVHFSSVVQSCLTLCGTMDCSTPGLPVHHQLPEPAQTHVHRVGDAIQPSHPLSSPSPAFNLSQHQSLFQWGSSSHQVAKVLEFQLQHQSLRWIFKTDFL